MTRTPGTPGLNRAEFLARVRDALGRPRAKHAAAPSPPPVDESIVRLGHPGPDLVEVFATNAQAAGVTVHHADPNGLPGQIATLLETLRAKTVTMSFDDPDLAAAVNRAAEAARCRIVDYRSRRGLDAHYDADAGITDVEAALAETGTLIVSSGEHHSRGTFVVPPVHIAIVRVRDIIPDMIDYWKLRPHPIPTATILITGPSKTADIEGILVTGVHGPREVHVVIVAA